MDSEKCWRRRLRNSTSVGLLAIVALIGPAGSQPAPDTTAAGLARLEDFLSGVESLTAEFTQELWTADHELLQTEGGTLALHRPNRFRWTYREPTELTIVADGATLWIYDVELAQVTVAPLDSTVGSSPAMLLSGDRAVRDGFDVVQAYSLDGLEWVKLAPKTPGSDFTSVLIGFSGSAPRRLEFVDGLNQVTRIALDELAVNPSIDSGTFEFAPPVGVDVIGGG